MLSPSKVEAKNHSGIYINDDGCLAVCPHKTIFFRLIKYDKMEDIMCNPDGSPVVLGDETCCSS